MGTSDVMFSSLRCASAITDITSKTNAHAPHCAAAMVAGGGSDGRAGDDIVAASRVGRDQGVDAVPFFSPSKRATTCLAVARSSPPNDWWPTFLN
eukprot:5577819-Prymnesium_polylepis.1